MVKTFNYQRTGVRVLAVFAAIVLVRVALGQDAFEYGSPDDLKGVTSVYVYTGTDTELRENIREKLTKELPNLTLASRSEEAQVHLIFSADISTYVRGVNTTAGPNTNYSQSNVQYGRVVDGRGLVLKVEAGKQPILLFDFKDSRSTIFARRPSTNFAKAFVKAYKKANGLE